MKLLTALLLLFMVLGCTDVKKDGYVALDNTSTSFNVSSTLKSVSSSASTTTQLEMSTTLLERFGWIKTPADGCKCVKWSCPDESSVETYATTTTCITIPDLDYKSQTKFFEVKIKGNRFSPKNIKAMVNDIVSVSITSEQGLHKIRDTYTNRTILIQPGETYEMTFVAENEGVYLLTCNPFCEDPMEATITISQPYKQFC